MRLGCLGMMMMVLAGLPIAGWTTPLAPTAGDGIVQVEREFAPPNGPLIWDFSGNYPAPVGNSLHQRPDGTLVGTNGTSGLVEAEYSSVHLRLVTPGSAHYWIQHGPVDKEYILQNTCTKDLWLYAPGRNLSGTRECITISQEYILFLWVWAPYRQLTTNRTFDHISVSLPENVDGRWRLALEIAPGAASSTAAGPAPARQPSGTARVTLGTTNTFTLPITGFTTNVTRHRLALDSPPNHLDLVALGPGFAIHSLSGRLSGQPVQYQVPETTTPLALSVEGPGRVSGPTNLAPLVIGRDYTFSAVPSTDALFLHWNIGGTVVERPRVTVAMAPGLEIQARFVTNRFLGIDGLYQGLFHEQDVLRLNSAGHLTLSLTQRGAFSGRLTLDGRVHGFRGSFPAEGAAQITIPRGAAAPISATLQLDTDTRRLEGILTDGQWTAALTAGHAFSGDRDPDRPYEGVHTVALPGGDSLDGIVGDSFLSFWIDYQGLIHAQGRLADDTPISPAGRILEDGTWPMLVRLYQGHGALLGWLALTNRPVTGLTGDVAWFKPARPGGRLHPGGITNRLAAAGSPFIAPSGLPPGLWHPFADGIAHLSGGNLPESQSGALNADGTSAEIPGLFLRWSVVSGVVDGTFLHPATSRPARIRGVLLQNASTARGWFPGTNQSGQLLLRMD